MSTQTVLRSTTMTSPVGELTVVASSAGVRAVLWPLDGPDRVRLTEVESSGGSDAGIATDRRDEILAAAVDQLEDYFRGERTAFDVPLDAHGTGFQLDAWRALQTIAFGTTISYGEQADRMGDKRKARAVGAANGRNPISIIVPCHRVVGSTGALTGFAGGMDAKRWLLDHESRVAGHTLV
ncbi:MAG: methylated-DNA--[protein]-cysteine S-methyltransferase [Ilumatobacter sp.]|uniref:methylated-DNA--[protein]-cysteine S-methyltransferase n=1 Tax=Ilumatobacter sp. TaxID=1967498 RepID=UPI003298C4B9